MFLCCWLCGIQPFLFLLWWAPQAKIELVVLRQWPTLSNKLCEYWFLSTIEFSSQQSAKVTLSIPLFKPTKPPAQTTNSPFEHRTKQMNSIQWHTFHTTLYVNTCTTCVCVRTNLCGMWNLECVCMYVCCMIIMYGIVTYSNNMNETRPHRGSFINFSIHTIDF